MVGSRCFAGQEGCGVEETVGPPDSRGVCRACNASPTSRLLYLPAKMLRPSPAGSSQGPKHLRTADPKGTTARSRSAERYKGPSRGLSLSFSSQTVLLCWPDLVVSTALLASPLGIIGVSCPFGPTYLSALFSKAFPISQSPLIVCHPYWDIGLTGHISSRPLPRRSVSCSGRFRCASLAPF